ncbi:MAG: UbiA family prenyltransferase, partial [Pseudomonadota bacterium]|nr:UbiA family prenyltransferase [Pseudomonadota bacterium]
MTTAAPSSSLRPYLQLTRLDKPVGIGLLLWPTLWALWLAAEGRPAWPILGIFLAGVVLTRSAGCAINDYADRNFDGHVARTQHRPLATGALQPRDALRTAAALTVLAFILVLFTNPFTVALAPVAVVLA